MSNPSIDGKTDPSRWNRFSGCPPDKIRQTEDEFDKMEQFGQVKIRLIHLDGFNKMDQCKRTLSI